jgi:hypothetical protein
VSGIWEQDRFSGDIPDVLHGNAATWGNSGGRVAWEAPLGGLRARHTAGVARYGAVVREVESDPNSSYSAPTERPSTTALRYLFMGSEIGPPAGRSPLGWSGGYQLILQSARYDGPPPEIYGHRASDTAAIARATDLTVAAAWAERRWKPSDRVEVHTGLRVETGKRVRGGGMIRPAPRLSARYQASPELALSLGLARTYQYSQAAGSLGPHLYFPTNHLWVLAGAEDPVLRSDIGTFGAEAWMGDGWLAAVNAYRRHATGAATKDPAPGALHDLRTFVYGDNVAHGVELSTRRLIGRWTGSAAYAYGVSEMTAEGMRFPADQDRRHSLNATAMFRPTRRWRLGAAYTATTGAPFTRVYANAGSCLDAECDGGPRVEEPNAMRAPGYASLDLLVDWTRSFRRWDVGAYLQLRNVLGSDNSILYTGSRLQCSGARVAGECTGNEVMVDHFDPGIPTIPLFGVRVRF